MKIETYWGWSETLISTQHYCLKRLFMRKHTQSSLEYHVKKHETYLIESGKLMVGLRQERAKNATVTLVDGDAFTIMPGQMHMRIALEDTTILEVSTQDSPLDTYIVEDGRYYNHLEDE